MKKALLTAAITVCAVGATAGTGYAASVPNVQIADSWNGIASVSGTAEPGSYVSLVVLNPDTDEAEFAAKPSAAVQFYAGDVAKKDFVCEHGGNTVNYCFHFKIDGENGEYTVITTADGSKNTQKLTFSSVEAKQQSIKDINGFAKEEDSAVKTKNLDTAMKNFALNTNALYVGNDKEAIVASLVKLTPEGGFAYNDTEAVNSMEKTLKKACLIAAYNTDKEDIVAKDGSLLYLDSLLSLSETDEFEDYNGTIENGSGTIGLLSDKSLVMSDMFKKTYKSLEEIEEAFKKSVRFRVLVDYNARGYGHVADYFEKYEDYYTDVGFKFSAFEKISDKSDIYSAVAASDAEDIDELKDEFNDEVDDARSEKKSSGGGNRSGGSVPNYTADANDKDDTKTEDNAGEPTAPVIETVGGFGDVPVTYWAAEAIGELAADGVLAGKDGGVFDPNGTITRAELTKIIVAGVLGGIDEAAENPFGDSSNHWAEKYIATAVKAGVVTGISTSQFDPDGLVTREQAAAIICRALTAKGAALEASADLFDDNSTIGDWAVESVYKLKGAGIISGRGENNFCGQDLLTRAEAAKLAHSARNFK